MRHLSLRHRNDAHRTLPPPTRHRNASRSGHSCLHSRTRRVPFTCPHSGCLVGVGSVRTIPSVGALFRLPGRTQRRREQIRSIRQFRHDPPFPRRCGQRRCPAQVRGTSTRRSVSERTFRRDEPAAARDRIARSSQSARARRRSSDAPLGPARRGRGSSGG